MTSGINIIISGANPAPVAEASSVSLLRDLDDDLAGFDLDTNQLNDADPDVVTGMRPLRALREDEDMVLPFNTAEMR